MKRWNSIYLIFKSFMAFVYLFLGVLFLFFNVLPAKISNTGRIFLGIVLLLYGIYRIYSNYTGIKAKREE
jgi:Na+/phosphate symporter